MKEYHMQFLMRLVVLIAIVEAIVIRLITL
jgi:hypothetical protein